MGLIVGMVISGIIGALIGHSKGQAGRGFLLALLCGPLGWIAVARMKAVGREETLTTGQSITTSQQFTNKLKQRNTTPGQAFIGMFGFMTLMGLIGTLAAGDPAPLLISIFGGVVGGIITTLVVSLKKAKYTCGNCGASVEKSYGVCPKCKSLFR